MNPLVTKDDVVLRLQKEVLSMQRRIIHVNNMPTDLGPIEAAFPDSIFPIGAVHEFISYMPHEVAATNGFISGILGKIVQRRHVMWIAHKQCIYPHALSQFGIAPERVIFANISKKADALWTIEEALNATP